MERHSEASPRLGRIVLVLALLAIGVTLYGWRQAHYGWSDSIFLALKSITMGAAYEEIYDQRPGNVALDVGRFLGTAVEMSTFLLIGGALFYKRFLHYRIRLFYSNHCIIFGESNFADRIASSLKRQSVHFRSLAETPRTIGKSARLPFVANTDHSLRLAGARKCQSIMIASEDDMRGIELALAVQRRLDESRQSSQVYLRLNDYWLAQRLHDLTGAERVQSIAEPALVARDAIRRFPPYLIAEDQQASRVHALLIGEPDWIEALMSEMLLSATTLRYGKPALSFVCKNASQFRDRLRQRYPEIDEEAEIRLFDLAETGGRDLAGFHLQDLPAIPVTAVYSLFPEGAHAVSAYLSLHQQACQDPGFKAPVFVLAEGKEISSPAPGSWLMPLQFVPIGGYARMIQACGLLADDAELAEQRYHAAYLEFAPSDGDAARPWKDLREEYRISNRRAVAHILAKLFEAGFDLRTWMASHDIWSELPALAEGQRLFHTEVERERLSVLEHMRWMVDRRLGGWRYGETRDNATRLHPDLKPFEDLSPKIQDYDRNFIALLDRLLPRKPDGMGRA
jgi:hypothetical protein